MSDNSREDSASTAVVDTPMSMQEPSGLVESEHPPSVVTVATECDDMEVLSLEELACEENSRQAVRLSAPRRYFRYALCLWIFEFLLVVVLKRLGVLEQGFHLEKIVTDKVLPRINESIPLSYLMSEKKRPGFMLAEQGARANYPVVIIPGFVTSGLELWSGKDCAKKFFRQRLWAAFSGARSFLVERDCWRQHMMLDPFTGDDPEGIKLRAAQGFEAADYFVGSYWVWGKLILNLADVGYTPSLMSMEAYDWRLSFPMLEKRDGYLTKLRYRIESLHKTTGKKVVLTSHSMGALLIHYFFAWVTTSEARGGGGCSSTWVNDHVHAYVNIAGPHLGVPKAASALLSGELSDTVLTGMMGNMAEQFFGRKLRRDLWNTWGSLWAMLPKGGDAIWGVGADICANTATSSDNDPFCSEQHISPLLKMAPRDKEIDAVLPENPLSCNKLAKDFASREGHSVQDVLSFLQSYGAGLGPSTAASRDFSLFGPEKDSSRVWHDPTRTPLPHAPNMRLYCFYGVGIDTERAYYYRKNQEETCDAQGIHPTIDPPVIHDSSPRNSAQKTEFGIRFTNGDGSVPLMSLGYICADAWRRGDSGLNPSGTKIITREYLDQSEFHVEDPMRGGPRSAEHVDILGNVDMTEDFLRVVTGFDSDEVEADHIVSNIEQIAAMINSHPNGGVRRKRWLDKIFKWDR